MISNELRLLASEEIEKMPDYKKGLLREFDWLHEIENIGAKYQLSPEQSIIFYQETIVIILDLADPENYAYELINRAGIAEQTVKNICQDVVERITNKIQELSDTIYGDLAIDIKNELQKKFDEEGSLDQLKDMGLTISDTPITTDTVPTPQDKVQKTISMEEQKVKSYDQSDPYHEPLE